MNSVSIINSPSDDAQGADVGTPVPRRMTPVQWGMISFLVSEVAFFGTLITAYVAFLGANQSGPTPEVLSLSLVVCTTICLLASSGTIHLAELKLRGGAQSAFLGWWAITIILGVLFLVGTALEWYELITQQGLTISRNLFGSTFYMLVGFHALHVTVGVIAMGTVLSLALRGAMTCKHHVGVEMVSWYWHFVDVVWIVVFTIVYLLGR